MYVVEWVNEAVRELAEIWVNSDSPERARITSAVTLLDRLLRDEPAEQGESRDGEDRITFAAPLGISYEIDQADRHVTVLSVWRFATRE